MDAIDPAMPLADAAFQPIRTPDDYVAALDASLTSLQEAVLARREGRPDSADLADRAAAMADAISAAPFRILGGSVVAKGFTPRLVA